MVILLDIAKTMYTVSSYSMIITTTEIVWTTDKNIEFYHNYQHASTIKNNGLLSVFAVPSMDPYTAHRLYKNQRLAIIKAKIVLKK
jgi:hypothetical protein